MLCDGALGKITGLLTQGVLPRDDWTAIRVSYGLCGIIMQVRARSR